MATPPLPGLPPAASREAQRAVALAHFNAHRFDEAKGVAQALLAADPRDWGALNLLGGIAMAREDYAEAVRVLTAATSAAPNNPHIWFNCGEALRRSGDLKRAAARYRKATSLKPDFAEAHAQMGDCLRAAGEPREAEAAFGVALKLQPTHVLALQGLGRTRLSQQRFAEAADLFTRALAHARPRDDSGRAALTANLSQSMRLAGDAPSALTAALDACALAPDNDDYLRHAARCLRYVREAPEHPVLRDVLTALLAREDVNPRPLATATLSLLRRTLSDEALLRDDLFLQLLRVAPIPDAGIEMQLRNLRAEALRSGAGDIDVLCALGEQNWLNEYVPFVADDERALLDALGKCLETNSSDWTAWAIWCAYRPLTGAPVPFPRDTAPPQFAPLITMQIDEPARERERRAELRTLRPIGDGTSRAVQAMYEENPYPRWTRADRGAPTSVAEALRAAGVDAPALKGGPRILVAGCGTGLETVRVLATYKDASIVALDLSAASLAYGMRKLSDIGATNVTFVQGDILDAALLNERFDIIHSFGVIHHMRDPAAGLAALADRLSKNCLLCVGLYSEIGRASVVAAREIIARRGYPQNAEGVRQARADMMRERDPALAPLMSPASDFWTTSDCRDLIFHVEEHRFTLLDIDAMFAACGLDFVALELSNPGDRFRFEQKHPGASRSLSAWHAFETAHPETFGDTYRLWTRKR